MASGSPDHQFLMTTLTPSEKPRTGTRMSWTSFWSTTAMETRRWTTLEPRPPVSSRTTIWTEAPAQFYHEMTTILSRELQRAPEPDIVIILSERQHIVGRSRVEGAPDIVVEILSTDRSRDLVRKRQIYAEAGVLEYWPIDPYNDNVTQLELHDGAYVERAVLGVEDELTTPLLPGLAIPLAEIFQHRRRPARDE